VVRVPRLTRSDGALILRSIPDRSLSAAPRPGGRPRTEQLLIREPLNLEPLNLDPRSIPQRRLYTGAKMPAIGLGTFGSDQVSAEQVAQAVRGAAAFGYRHFDCASVYGNEAEVGAALGEAMAGGIRREDLWITSKLWNDKHGEQDVIDSCRKSLADLRLDYLDLYLVHWPFPNFHPPGCDVGSRSADAQPYLHESYMKTWRRMEELVDMGLVRHIGTSNMTVAKLKLVLRDARIKPAANEMELHPHFQQPELFQFVIEHGIGAIGYCPIGSPGRPERDPVIVKIAANHGVAAAAVCLKWAVQRGQTPIPFSINHYRENLAAVAGDALSEDEMREIAGIDRGCRLIKGQVFLWKEGQSWEDLWDMNGAITPP
jgi:alcohol dehydrogenase (NADP+)